MSIFRARLWAGPLLIASAAVQPASADVQSVLDAGATSSFLAGKQPSMALSGEMMVAEAPPTQARAGSQRQQEAAPRVEGKLAAGAKKTARFETSNDQDTYQLTLKTDNSYLFRLKSHGNARLVLRDRTGQLVKLTPNCVDIDYREFCFRFVNPPSGERTFLRNRAAGGTYYLTVEGGGRTGGYDVRFDIWDTAGGPSTEGKMKVGDKVKGSANSDNYEDDSSQYVDDDWRQITLSAGIVYRFSLSIKYEPTFDEGGNCYPPDPGYNDGLLPGLLRLFDRNEMIFETRAVNLIGERYHVTIDKAVGRTGPYFVSVTGCGHQRQTDYELSVQALTRR